MQIARAEAFKKFGTDSLNDSSKKYKEAMEYIKARQAELNNTSADSLNKIQSDLEKVLPLLLLINAWKKLILIQRLN